MTFPKRRSPRGRWLVAFALTLILHGGTLLGFRMVKPFSPTPVQARNPDPIELVFSEPAETADSPSSPKDEPTMFTELPPDRADEAPEQADFLSNVDSRARDQVPGGDQALPRLQGDADAPMVAIEADGGSPLQADPSLDERREPSPPGTAPDSREIPPAEIPADASGDAPKPDGSLRPDGTPAAPPNSEALRRAREQSALLLQRPRGRAEFSQPEMSYLEGNAPLSGDVTLNTTAWEYAPWLQQFHRELMSRWFAPTAYYMGILKEGGWALFEIEVAKTGDVLRLDLLEEQGHASLTKASRGALDATAPLEPLPGDFPEKTLVMRLRMVYPKVRSR